MNAQNKVGPPEYPGDPPDLMKREILDRFMRLTTKRRAILGRFVNDIIATRRTTKENGADDQDRNLDRMLNDLATFCNTNYQGGHDGSEPAGDDASSIPHISE